MYNYELRIETSEFKKALDVLSTVINKKNALPILGCACVRYDRERKLFTMTAGNSEQWMQIECWRADDQADDGHRRWMFNDSHGRADDKREPLQAFCVNVEDFREAFATLPSMPAMCFLSLDVQQGGGSIRVTYGKGEFTLPVQLATEYPQVPTVIERDGEEKREGVQPLVKFSIETQRMLPLIAAARVCSANDELRPVMNTVVIDAFFDKAVIVASDGHSLYKHNLDTGMGWLRYGEFAVTESAKILIPTQAISPLVKAFAATETLTLTADTQRICIESPEGIKLTTLTIEGRYPNYESVIPKDNPHRLLLDRAELAATLRRVSIFSAEASNLAILKRNEEHVGITANDDSFGRNAAEQVSIINTDDCQLPDGFQIGFKISTMLQLLGCISTDNVAIELSDPSRAVLLKEDDRVSGLTLLQMPMVVN